LDAVEVLRGVEGISFIHFDERDVVRHSLVQRIVKAYEKYNDNIAGRQLTLKLATDAPPGISADDDLAPIDSTVELSPPAIPGPAASAPAQA
jgi:hypothetical protein